VAKEFDESNGSLHGERGLSLKSKVMSIKIRINVRKSMNDSMEDQAIY
jgi:hypothetical protein